MYDSTYEIISFLCADTGTLPFIDISTNKCLRRMGIVTIRDLIFTAPIGVVDRRLCNTVTDKQPSEVVTVVVRVVSRANTRQGAKSYRVVVEDSSCIFDVVFFGKKANALAMQLPVGSQRVISGRLDMYGGRYQISHPDYIVRPENIDKIVQLEVIYPLTSGITLYKMRTIIHKTLSLIPKVQDWLADYIRKREKFPEWNEAIRMLHNPTRNPSVYDSERRRFAYDELLFHQFMLAKEREKMRAAGRTSNLSQSNINNIWQSIESSLSFKLTCSQQKVITQIDDDLRSCNRMLRMLQGDVGSGKTIVAIAAIAKATEMGGQSALMVPTEILARQHYASIQPLLEKTGVRSTLLLGGAKSKKKQNILHEIANGEIHVVIGTHAIFQQSVIFHSLQLVVIDEQHRFGVEQREELLNKGYNVDLLVMSATPIPRSLMITRFGDMDISIIDEKPKNRPDIKTCTVSLSRIEELCMRLEKAIQKGSRVYWVCPLVSESEKSDLMAAVQRYEHLQHVFGDDVVGIVHGKMTGDDKDIEVARFQRGEINVLVATTVIEVGIDVPEANIMVIEHAENFGMVQLHQLRGRVGRGSTESSCILLYGDNLSEQAVQRLAVLKQSNDGFYISEIDLKMRGAGEMLGKKQSGTGDFIFVDMLRHADIIVKTRIHAQQTLRNNEDITTSNVYRVLFALIRREDVITYDKMYS